MILRKPILLALLSLTMLPACSPTLQMPAPRTQPDSPIKAVPCVNLPVIRFHAPQTMPDAGYWASGTLADTPNAYDTTDTVKAIRRANAARVAVCGP